MNLDTFFEKFELFADAPNAVAKMRELILHLAGRGKLVPQDLHDDQVELSFPTLTNFSEKIDNDTFPSNWLRVPLGKLGEWRGGGTPSKARTDYWNGHIPWVSPKDMKILLISDAQDHISQKAVEESSVRMIPPGSILMVVRGMILAHSFPVALTKCDVTINQDMKALLPSEPATTNFILTALRSFKAKILSSVERSTHGTCKLQTEILEHFMIGIPPLAEQKRIVAKVDELMALCDRLEAQQQQRETRHTALAQASLTRFADAPTPANLELLFHKSYAISAASLRKSILTLAVQGNLSESSSNAVEWPLVAMKDVSLQITDGEHATPQRISSGVPLATAKNVRDGFLDLTTTDYVAQSTAEKCWKRCKPGDQDILMVCVGATTGRICLAQNPPDIVLVRSVALIRPNQELIAPSYLDLFLRSPAGQSQIWGNVKQSAQPCLYLGKMAEFEISLPPLAEQKRIVAKVEQLMGLVDRLEAQLAESRAKATALLEAVVAELSAAA